MREGHQAVHDVQEWEARAPRALGARPPRPCLTAKEADTLLSYAEVGFRDELVDHRKRPAFVNLVPRA